jgi:glycosyltransferase involved in cell wall biosynthesis
MPPEGAAVTLLHVYSTFATGGPQVRFAAIANHFGRRWKHAIIAMDGNTACRERLDPGLDVTFPDAGIVKGDTLGNLRRFRALLREMKPSALVTSNWGSIEWAMANALPIVRHVHVEDGFGPEERDRQIPRRVWTRRIFLRRCTVVLPSRVLENLARNVWKLPGRHIRYVPNGIDFSRFDGSGAAPNPVPVIGTVAALRAEKNLSRLLRAFRLLRDAMPARLVIVGDGPERAKLEALAGELGLAEDVRFTGHVAAPQALYAGFDVFALSSDTEQMPLSVLEAMGARLPVAATEVGDVRGMLDAANGAFVVPQNETALAGAMGTLLRDANLRHALGAANRARAERDYDQARMFASWAALFDGTAGAQA